MEPVFSVQLLGEPRGKGRPRFRIVQPRGKPQFVTVYTDSDTVKYEDRLRAVASDAMGGREPWDEPLSVLVEAFMPIPTSWSARQKERALQGHFWPTGKPDGDNILKMLDACNKVIWRDDSLIVQAVVRKQYCVAPRLVVSVWRWML